MTRRKRRQIPQAAELPRLFDETFVAQLIRQGKLPTGTDVARFRAGILNATTWYVAAMTVPIGAEIAALFSAAARYRYRETARRVAELSESIRNAIEKRGNRRSVGLCIPDLAAFTDPARRDEACDTIIRLLRVGMKEGKPILYLQPAPTPRKGRREAELRFVLLLAYTFQDATGVLPSYTANPGRRGPFARLVQEFLDRVNGVGVVNAVEMLNELNRRRKNLRRWIDLRARWEWQANQLVRRLYLQRQRQFDELLRRWEQSRKLGTAPKP